MKFFQNLSYKTLFAILFFTLAGIVFFIKIGGKTEKVSAAWWDDMWHYRKAITVTNDTNYDSTNIPYKINLDTQTLISNGKLQSDADDIRIVDSNGNIVRHQIEQSTLNTTTSKVWFEATVNSNSSATYYIYYGNPSAPAPNFISDIQNISNTTTTTTIEMKDGFGYTTNRNNGGRVSDIRKNNIDLGVDGNINYSGSYPGNWWSSSFSSQNILNSTGPLFAEIVYSAGATGSYSAYESDVKVFDNGFAETRLSVTYNTTGSENFYYYLSFTSGTRNSVWVDNSGTLIDQSTNSGTLYESSLGQNWFGQRWTDTDKYGGTIITKNGSDWHYGYTSAQASYFQTNYSYSQSFTGGSSREVRFGVFAGDGGLSEMTQKGANYGALGLTINNEEIGTAPIAYWKFDEGVGSTAYDSANNNHGNLVGNASYVDESQCISNKCLNFDSNGDYVYPGSKPALNNLESFTLSAWINMRSRKYIPTIINKGPETAAQHIWWGINSNNTIWLELGDTNSYTNYGSNTLSWDTNKWYFLTATVNNQTKEVKHYRDGVLVKTLSFSGRNFNSGTYETSIGRYYANSAASYDWDGYLDEVKIYPYARTADQVKLDYNSRGSLSGSSANLGVKSNTTPSLSSKLVAYYKFDEGSGTKTNNSINNGVGLSGVFAAGTSAPTWTNNGKINKGLNFGGVNYLTITDSNDSLDFGTGDFTISFFTFKTANGYQGGSYIRKGNYTGGFDSYDNMFRVNTVNGELAHINLNATLNKWEHHSFVVTQNSTQYINHYIDGKLNNAGYVGVGNTGVYGSDSFSDLIIGYSNAGGGQRFFNGSIDELKIYNYALTPEEIKQDYNAGSAIQFGTSNQTIGGTTTSLNYCIPGDASTCSAPVAEWNFEENTGTTAKDTSGNNNNGTFGTGNSAPTWSIGKKNTGAGLKFDGNDYINGGVTQGHTGNLNINFWIKTNSSTIGTIISKYGNNSYWTYRIYTDTNGKINFERGNNTAAWVTTLISNKSVNDNNWHFISANYDSTKMYIYIDGQLDNSVAETRAADGTNYYNFCIGNDHHYCTPAGPKGFFHGSLDSVKIYDYARTPAQIAYDYNKGAPVGWWKMDECQGSTINDSSGVGNTGVIVIGSSGTQNSIGTCQIGTSAAWTNGASGHTNSSLNFDGTDDYVWLGNNSLFCPSNITVSSWFKAPSNSTGTIIRNRGSGFGLSLGSGTVNTYVYQATGSNLGTSTSTTYGNNLWHHAIMTYDGATIKLYIDGVLKNSQVGTGTGTIYCAGNAVGIGRDADYSGSYFTGQVDDVRIYNYALTAEQVKQVYNGGAVNFN